TRPARPGQFQVRDHGARSGGVTARAQQAPLSHRSMAWRPGCECGTQLQLAQGAIAMCRRGPLSEARTGAGRAGSGRDAAMNALLARALLSMALVFVQTTCAPAQDRAAPSAVPSAAQLARQGYALSKSDAEGLEALLASNPSDLAARTKLLGFYFRGA